MTIVMMKLTAKWNALRYPLSIVAYTSCRSQQFEATFACVRRNCATLE